jgi:hypothetical protein
LAFHLLLYQMKAREGPWGDKRLMNKTKKNGYRFNKIEIISKCVRYIIVWIYHTLIQL